MIKIGLIGRADNGGLGVQTKDFFDFVKPFKTLVVDISGLNGHTSYHEQRYEGMQVSSGFPTRSDLEPFLKGLDVVFTIETPYSYELLELAKQKNIKTIIQYNYEFLDYLQNNKLQLPDALWSPSLWHFDEIVEKYGDKCRVIHMPPPVDRQRMKYLQRNKAQKFLHIAGRKTYEDRNGTFILLDALQYIQAQDIEIVIRTQQELPIIDDYRVKINNNDCMEYWNLYNDEDVLLLPRKYGGLSLQLAEAMSCGMLAVMPDISPQNKFLPSELLMKYDRQFIINTRTEIDVYEVSAIELAKKIDYLAGLDKNKCGKLSRKMDDISKEWSWETMLPKYIEEMQKLCSQ